LIHTFVSIFTQIPLHSNALILRLSSLYLWQQARNCLAKIFTTRRFLCVSHILMGNYSGKLQGSCSVLHTSYYLPAQSFIAVDGSWKRGRSPLHFDKSIIRISIQGPVRGVSMVGMSFEKTRTIHQLLSGGCDSLHLFHVS
jgi:hypothetical protein